MIADRKMEKKAAELANMLLGYEDRIAAILATLRDVDDKARTEGFVDGVKRECKDWLDHQQERLAVARREGAESVRKGMRIVVTTNESGQDGVEIFRGNKYLFDIWLKKEMTAKEWATLTGEDAT